MLTCDKGLFAVRGTAVLLACASALPTQLAGVLVSSPKQLQSKVMLPLFTRAAATSPTDCRHEGFYLRVIQMEVETTCL